MVRHYRSSVPEIANLADDDAVGMFLYAQIVMDNLLAQLTVGDVLNVLESSRFPTDLASA